jgi:cytochrome c551
MGKFKWMMGLMALTLALSLSACGGKKEATNNGEATGNTNTSGGTVAVDAAAAETVYKANCVSCHAVDLAGGVGPNLQKVGNQLTIQEITTRINNGGGGMPAFKGQLSNAEIANLAGWLGSMK